MKGLFLSLCLLSICLTFAEDFHGVAVSDDVIKGRKKLAVEIISSDEGFLSEYYDQLTRHDMLYFYILAFDSAEKVAEETLLIFIEEDAYLYMMNGIEGKNGVKDQIEEKVYRYLKNDYTQNEIDINKYYEAHRCLNAMIKYREIQMNNSYGNN